MTEAFEVTWTGPRRRRMIRFRRREIGGWIRIEREFREGAWHTVGQEFVGEVSVEVDGAVADAVDVVDAPVGESVAGPAEGRP